MLHRLTTIVVVCLVLVSQILVGNVKPKASSNRTPIFNQADEVIPGVVIIKFRVGVNIQTGTTATTSTPLHQFLAVHHVNSIQSMFRGFRPLTSVEIASGKVDLSRIHYAFIDESLDPREIARELMHSPDIEYAEPKYVHHIEDTPNDPFFSNQANAFTRVNAINGWTSGKGDSTVAIATIDGGTNWQHEDLLPNVWINPAEDINHNGRFDQSAPPSGDEDGIDQDLNGFVDDVVGWNFATNSNNPLGLVATPVSAGHGTATASIFGARTNNNIGMAGASWNCALMSVCAADPVTDGSIYYPYEGIAYAYMSGAKVINCSFGRTGGVSLMEQEVVTAATQAGALVVASAGNGGADQSGDNNDLTPHYPSSYQMSWVSVQLHRHQMGSRHSRIMVSLFLSMHPD